MKVVFQHPTGNANVRAALTGLHEVNALDSFHTSMACFPGSILSYLANFAPFSEFRRRTYSEKLKSITEVYPWHEAGRLIASKVGFEYVIKHESGLFCIDAVYRNLDKKVAHLIKESTTKVDAIYAYEDGAVCTFREAKRAGISCLYDLPIGYWRTARRLLEEERKMWPQWACTLTGFKDSEEKLTRKDEELQLADKIFVASSFTASTLKDYQGTLMPVEVIPYGFPPIFSKRDYTTITGRPLKLLFVGGLSQRKGIANLFAAVENLSSQVTLTVVGRRSNEDCLPLSTALVKHSWIPSLPHHDVLKLMREHDVLVFPSLFEGFGLVITEAMSQGTPVITTDRTAGPDLINHGENGWLVEASSTHALRQCIEELLQKPEQIAKAGQAAMETAKLRPWKVYGRELAEAILQHQAAIT